MVDYSRFDHIGSDSEDDAPKFATIMDPPAASSDVAEHSEGSDRGSATRAGSSVTADAPNTGASSGQPTVIPLSKKGKEGRIKFEYQGRVVYEWEQTMDEVNIYIEPPRGISAKDICCKITPGHLRLGAMGCPPFIDEDTGGPVVVEESYWMMDGTELIINLQKMKKADTWPAALKSKDAGVDPVTLEDMQKKIMLERFQSENPGFDFSGAEFNGQVPDARTFMGGVKYT